MQNIGVYLILFVVRHNYLAITLRFAPESRWCSPPRLSPFVLFISPHPNGPDGTAPHVNRYLPASLPVAGSDETTTASGGTTCEPNAANLFRHLGVVPIALTATNR